MFNTVSFITDKEEALEILWQAAAKMCYGGRVVNEQGLLEFLDELSDKLGVFLSREEIEKAVKECFTNMFETAMLLSGLDLANLKGVSTHAEVATSNVLRNSQYLLQVWDECASV